MHTGGGVSRSAPWPARQPLCTMQQVRVKVITIQDFSGLPSHAPPASPQGLPPLGSLTDLTQLSHALTARPANYPQHSQEQPVWGAAPGPARCINKGLNTTNT